jgi:hypothetical protein
MSRSAKEEKLIAKIQKEYPDFYDSLQSLTVDELQEKLASHAKHREETLKAKEDCVPLNEAKELVAEISGPFNDTLKMLSLRSKYIYLLMQEKGGA